MATVFLHCGFHKTGTTSIQEFLARNAGPLLLQSVLYPFTGRKHGYSKQHHALAFACLNKNESPFVIPFQPSISLYHIAKNLDQEIRQVGAEKVILSSEYFSDPSLSYQQLEQLISTLDSHDCFAIFYIRDKDKWFESLYAQAVAGYSQTQMRFGDYRSWALARGLGDFDAVIKKFETILGVNRVKIIPYDTVASDLVENFSNLTEISIDSSFHPVPRLNSRPSWACVRVLRHANALPFFRRQARRFTLTWDARLDRLGFRGALDAPRPR